MSVFRYWLTRLLPSYGGYLYVDDNVTSAASLAAMAPPEGADRG